MTEYYNQAIAAHYSAYRPPLHQMILSRVLTNEESFSAGLDVGCGTGYSAVALAKYCRQVFGVEPSQSMLDKAMPHEKISYLKGAGEKLPIPDNSVDVATFAGSLFYIKSDTLIQEMKRVCRKGTVAIPYDFQILLDDCLVQLDINLKKTASNYIHTINFSDSDDFTEIMNTRDEISLKVTASELAHLLLSEVHRYEAFIEKYSVDNPFAALTGELESSGKNLVLEARIFYSKYELKCN